MRRNLAASKHGGFHTQKGYWENFKSLIVNFDFES